ncbi:hypothetical protein LCGC14_1087750 [marine sediment metagenome]|uniref:Uncharacterized protein n=1 Tax=marine sediment metagenome TaxID=412755 RepID=A0A0F9MDI8_9ZZZZ
MENDFKFNLQNHAEDPGIVQPTGDIFEIDGKQVPYSELTPQQVRAFYDTHRNQANFSQANTQRSQELAAKQKEFDDLKQSYENELQDYRTIQQYLNTHADLASMVNNYVQVHPEQSGAGQSLTGQPGQPGQPGMMQNNRQNLIDPQLVERLEKVEKMVTDSTGRLEEGERTKSRSDALTHLRDTYKDGFKEESFNDFFMNKTGDLSQMKDLYNLVHLAQLGSQRLAETTKQGSGLESGETTSGKIEPNIVIDPNSGVDPIDQVTEAFAKEQGIKDY